MIIFTGMLYLSFGNDLHAQVFPVYFADVFNEGNNNVLHFEWRSDFKSYDKAIIQDESGHELGEVRYPGNTFRLSNLQENKFLSIVAVGLGGEKSEPARVNLNNDYNLFPVSETPERIIIRKSLSENAKFVGAQSGKDFIVKGVNFCGIHSGDHDTFEPCIIATPPFLEYIGKRETKPAFALHKVSLGDTVHFYDTYRTETLMRTLQTKGYNFVRVFIKTGGRGSQYSNIRGMSGPADTEGLCEPYMNNFVDFLTRAQKYGIYVMPCFSGNEMMDNDYFKERSKGASGQGILFSEDGIKAKQHYIELFLTFIINKNPELMNSLFALSMQNEFAFHSFEAPFNQTSGTYTFIDGSEYDMADDDQRRALANKAICNYYSKMKETVEMYAPGLLVGEGTFAMGAVGKNCINSKGIRTEKEMEDLRFPMTALELLNTDIDFLDFHIYRWGASGNGKDVFVHFAENMKVFTPKCARIMKSKPIIMGEFGSFKENERSLDEAMVFVKELEEAALEFGFKGSCYWTINTFEQTRLWNLIQIWEHTKAVD